MHQLKHIIWFFLLFNGIKPNAFSQIRFWGEAGFIYSTSTVQPTNLYDAESFMQKKALKLPALAFGIKADYYLNYLIYISSGINYSQNGYDINADFILKEHAIYYYASEDPPDPIIKVRAAQRNSFLTVPFSIGISPQGRPLGLEAGVNLNYLIHSRITDTIDTLDRTATTNVTIAMPKMYLGVHTSVAYKIRRYAIRFTIKKFTESIYSENVDNYLLLKEAERRVQATSYYHLLKNTTSYKPFSISLQVGYRL